MAAPMTDAEKLREAIKRFRGWVDNEILMNWSGADMTIILAAAEAHLSTLPKVKTVERWAVTYWSLTDRATVCRMCVDEAGADRMVAGNGSTARKHQLSTLEWEEVPL